MITEFWLKAVQRLQQYIAKRLTDEKGQGLVEYALILAFIAIVVVVSLKFLQPAISTQLNNVVPNL